MGLGSCVSRVNYPRQVTITHEMFLRLLGMSGAGEEEAAEGSEASGAESGGDVSVANAFGSVSRTLACGIALYVFCFCFRRCVLGSLTSFPLLW